MIQNEDNSTPITLHIQTHHTETGINWFQSNKPVTPLALTEGDLMVLINSL